MIKNTWKIQIFNVIIVVASSEIIIMIGIATSVKDLNTIIKERVGFFCNKCRGLQHGVREQSKSKYYEKDYKKTANMLTLSVKRWTSRGRVTLCNILLEENSKISHHDNNDGANWVKKS